MMKKFDFEFEATTVEQDITLRHVLSYLPDRYKEELLYMVRALDGRILHKDEVIDDVKRKLANLRDELKELTL
jgi:hypothetical protein